MTNVKKQIQDYIGNKVSPSARMYWCVDFSTMNCVRHGFINDVTNMVGRVKNLIVQSIKEELDINIRND